MKKKSQSPAINFKEELILYLSDKKAYQKKLKTKLSKSERARTKLLQFLTEIGIATCRKGIVIQDEIQRRESKK